MRALVTGAGGFVGAHLVARLAADGWDVTGVVRPGGTGPARAAVAGAVVLAGAGAGGGVDLVEADLSQPGPVAEVAGSCGADAAFLLAAARAASTPAERAATAAVNATGALWLVDALPAGCRAVVRLGSSTEYGAAPGPMDEASPLRPRGFFGATKAAGSLLVAAAAAGRGMRAVVLRAFQVYGPGDHPGRLVPTLLRAARTAEVVPLTEPGRRRDWIYVDDVVEACVRAAAADHLAPGEVLNLGTGVQTANEDVAAAVAEVTGRAVRVAAGAHPGRHWDTGSWVCDPTRAAARLGWEAKVSLHEGLARCWAAETGGP